MVIGVDTSVSVPEAEHIIKAAQPHRRADAPAHVRSVKWPSSAVDAESPLLLLQAKEPKAIIKIDGINATFQPEKIGNPNGLQITYLKDNSTRSIFVYHDNGKVLP